MIGLPTVLKQTLWKCGSFHKPAEFSFFVVLSSVDEPECNNQFLNLVKERNIFLSPNHSA
jgi:hypothetical protein